MPFVLMLTEEHVSGVVGQSGFVWAYTRHQCCPARIAGRGCAVGIHESDPLVRQTLNIGSHSVGNLRAELFIRIDVLEEITRVLGKDRTNGLQIVDGNKKHIVVGLRFMVSRCEAQREEKREGNKA